MTSRGPLDVEPRKSSASNQSKPLWLRSWAWYLRELDQKPMFTKSWTSGVLSAVGDVMAQLFVEQRSLSEVELYRMFCFTLMSCCIGPLLHLWFIFMSRIIKAEGTSGAIYRLLLDQGLFAPFMVGLMMSLVVTMEGNPGIVPDKLRQDWKSTVLANWKLWVPCQFVNFRFVPQQLQVLVVNLVALIWNTYLSYASHTSIVTPSDPITDAIAKDPLI
ncbi:hypothetical protein WJX84_000081 [Apatococcus fuscideae]|uniref:Uncharacterized protein n=1 Tax=Apatococcus fuscideae TaxID=2026836 RepID=A0AAW1RF14_9CHLO